MGYLVDNIEGFDRVLTVILTESLLVYGLFTFVRIRRVSYSHNRLDAIFYEAILVNISYGIFDHHDFEQIQKRRHK